MTVPCLIRLRLLGRFCAFVEGDGSSQLKISSKKGVALLTYLALHPAHTVSRERLATLLWGDRPDQQARLNLRQCLLSLRKIFAPVSDDWIVLNGDSVGLRADRFSIDAVEFQKLSHAAEEDDLERAAALYSGPLVDELQVDAEEFMGWLDTMRARFADEVARVLEACIDRSEAANRVDAAIDAAERLVALDPLREDWQRRLIRLIASHRSSEVALSQVRGLVVRLKRELDVPPEPETLALAGQIRHGEIAPVKVDPSPACPAEAIGDADRPEASLVPLMPALLSASASASAGDVLPDTGRPRPVRRVGTPALWFAVPFVALLTNLAVLIGAHLMGLRVAEAPDEIASLASTIPGISPVVVLPFEGADKQTDELATLVSDSVIDQLSSVPNLRVISRLTSRQYAQIEKDVVSVGGRSNVRYLVHGSIRNDPRKWRVVVELIDVRSRLQIWSDQFDQEPADQATSQAIADRLGRSLRVAVVNFQGERNDLRP
jgi:DNA-binding SARP family transcriptional activator/TolB-like protein